MTRKKFIDEIFQEKTHSELINLRNTKMAKPEAKESIKAVAVCFACFEGFILKVKRSSALAGWVPVFISL